MGFSHLLRLLAGSASTLLGDEREGRLNRLPFVALRDDHPWVTNPEEAPGPLTEVSSPVLGLTVGIDQCLVAASLVRRGWMTNGNRWATGHEGVPGFPVAHRDGQQWNIEQLPALQVPCRLGWPTVLNLSVALRPGHVLGPEHPLVIATRIAARVVPIVVAAGNWGRVEGHDTLSPLARLPWCLAVAATQDVGGSELTQKSSAGSAATDTGETPRAPGPALAAYGRNNFVPDEYGTSFAAPRVSRQLIMLAAFVLQVAATESRFDGRMLETTAVAAHGMQGVPLPFHLGVDSGYADFDPLGALPLPMLPRLGVDRDAALELVSIVRQSGFNGALHPTPDALRAMVRSSARPMPAPRHHVGAGFVDDDTTRAFVTKLDGLALARLLAPGVSFSTEARERLVGLHLSVDDELEGLFQCARGATLKFAADFRNPGRYHSPMPPLPELASASNVWFES